MDAGKQGKINLIASTPAPLLLEEKVPGAEVFRIRLQALPLSLYQLISSKVIKVYTFRRFVYTVHSFFQTAQGETSRLWRKIHFRAISYQIEIIPESRRILRTAPV